MDPNATALALISGEARSLLTRLDNVMPFSLHMTMVGAAGASPQAHRAIQTHMDGELHRLRQSIAEFLDEPQDIYTPSLAQRRLSFLKLRFNLVLSHFDIYSDVLVQRSEHQHGVQLAGLDAVAADAMRIPGFTGEVPPALCYLDRGQGAAIRRARTRLPGGGDNPVALIRVPRERMIGSGIGSSLVHEVGHQVAALLDLVDPLRRRLGAIATSETARHSARNAYRNASANAADAAHGSPDTPFPGPAPDPITSPWAYFQRWISEIVADFWSILKLGVTSTMGLIGVVSLPTAFVFRTGLDDPHPFPWMRVQLSCAMGAALYPDPQWPTLAAAWERLYPLDSQSEQTQSLTSSLLDAVPDFIDLLLAHKPRALNGRTLGSLALPESSPQSLRRLRPTTPQATARLAPTTAIAAIGQSRFESRLSAAKESSLLRQLLVDWALRRFNAAPPLPPTHELIHTETMHRTGAHS